MWNLYRFGSNCWLAWDDFKCINLANSSFQTVVYTLPKLKFLMCSSFMLLKTNLIFFFPRWMEKEKSWRITGCSFFNTRCEWELWLLDSKNECFDFVSVTWTFDFNIRSKVTHGSYLIKCNIWYFVTCRSQFYYIEKSVHYFNVSSVVFNGRLIWEEDIHFLGSTACLMWCVFTYMLFLCLLNSILLLFSVTPTLNLCVSSSTSVDLARSGSSAFHWQTTPLSRSPLVRTSRCTPWLNIGFYSSSVFCLFFKI